MHCSCSCSYNTVSGPERTVPYISTLAISPINLNPHRANFGASGTMSRTRSILQPQKASGLSCRRHGRTSALKFLPPERCAAERVSRANIHVKGGRKRTPAFTLLLDALTATTCIFHERYHGLEEGLHLSGACWCEFVTLD